MSAPPGNSPKRTRPEKEKNNPTIEADFHMIANDPSIAENSVQRSDGESSAAMRRSSDRIEYKQSLTSFNIMIAVICSFSVLSNYHHERFQLFMPSFLPFNSPVIDCLHTCRLLSMFHFPCLAPRYYRFSPYGHQIVVPVEGVLKVLQGCSQSVSRVPEWVPRVSRSVPRVSQGYP